MAHIYHCVGQGRREEGPWTSLLGYLWDLESDPGKNAPLFMLNSWVSDSEGLKSVSGEPLNLLLSFAPNAQEKSTAGAQNPGPEDVLQRWLDQPLGRHTRILSCIALIT